jgi:hypothetical protein
VSYGRIAPFRAATPDRYSITAAAATAHSLLFHPIS